MRKWLVFVCISGLFLLALTGISGAVTISIWDEHSAPPELTAQEAVAKAFQKAHPEIKIAPAHFENTPWEWVLKATFAGGEPPSIIEVSGGSDLFQYVRAGQIMDITDFVRTRFDRLAVGTGVFELAGKYWGMPYYGSVDSLMWHNTDILRENGISVDSLHTWSGFLAACEKLKNSDITPIAYGNKEGWNGYMWWENLHYRLLGKEKYVESMKRCSIPGFKSNLKFTDPDAVKAWELYAKLGEKGYFSPGAAVDDYPAAYTYFLIGKAGFFQTGSWLIGTADAFAPEFPLGYTWFPAIEGYPGKYENILRPNHMVYAITTNNTPETYEAALKYLDWVITEDTAAIAWAEIGGLFPVYRISLAGLVNVNPLLKRQIEEAARAPESVLGPLNAIEFDICYEHTWLASQAILTGDLTPQEVAERLEKAIQKWQEKHLEKEILPSPSLKH